MTHVELYETYKKLDPTCTIGIVHMFHLLESLNNTAAERFIVHASDALMHDPVLSFFKTGTLTWLGQTLAINPSAPKSLDFFGVNYYTRELISWSPLKPWHLNRGALNPQENITDMGWPVYPEGLLKALQKAQQLDLPLYISENGIATTNPALRNEFIKKHLYVIQKALKQGFDIRGYTYWSLMDCYEWKYGYTKRFGLYFVDYAHNNQRSLCPGAISFVNFIKSRPCGTL